MTYTPEDAARDANRARCRAWYAENREQQRARCRETAKRKREKMAALQDSLNLQISENVRLVEEVRQAGNALAAIRDECLKFAEHYLALGREGNTPFSIAMQQRGISVKYCLDECDAQLDQLRAKGILVEIVDKPG